MHYFLIVSTTFYKEISEIISTIMKNVRNLRLRKYIIFTGKVKTS